jgi:hypothetical protein
MGLGINILYVSGIPGLARFFYRVAIDEDEEPLGGGRGGMKGRYFTTGVPKIFHRRLRLLN